MTRLPNDPMTQRSWYVVQTKPGNEYRVETNLSNQEIEVFLPLLETFQHSSGKMIQKIKPLFPNYLFAKLDINLHYYKVKSIYHKAKLNEYLEDDYFRLVGMELKERFEEKGITVSMIF